MASGNGGPAPQQLETLFEAGTAVGLSDRRLLERFQAGLGAEAAFAALVERHGPMVLRVCRDTLRDPHEADDAFQAVFLVLARRAGSIRKGDSVGPWLHGVALRVAACARSAAARRRKHERRGAAMAPESAPNPDEPGAELAPLLHAEIGRLPERNRSAVVLCYLEGLTHDEAAAQLGWPVGTVKSRLAWAREKLRSRLIRRGIMPSAALLTSTASSTRAANVPPALGRATIQLALHAAEAGAVPASVALLAERTLRTLLMTYLKWAASGLVAAGIVASAGAGLVAARQQPDDKPATKPAPKPTAPPAITNTPRPEPGGNVIPPGDRRSEEASSRSLGTYSREPLKVLRARLGVASDSFMVAQDLRHSARATYLQELEAKQAVKALAYEIISRRDELQDELEILEAEHAVKVANAQVSRAEMDEVAMRLGMTENLAARSGVSHKEVDMVQSALSIAKARQAAKAAEAGVFKVRIAQIRRRIAEAGPFADEAMALLKKATPDDLPPTAAPPKD